MSSNKQKESKVVNEMVRRALKEDLAEYFSNLCNEPVEKSTIYGETLEHLIIQLEFLSRISGALDFVKRTLGENMPERDATTLVHTNTSVQIVMDTINEKFGPRPR